MRSLATVESKKAWTLKPHPAGFGHTTPYFFTQKTTIVETKSGCSQNYSQFQVIRPHI